jgi:hypothetical protein
MEPSLLFCTVLLILVEGMLDEASNLPVCWSSDSKAFFLRAPRFSFYISGWFFSKCCISVLLPLNPRKCSPSIKLGTTPPPLSLLATFAGDFKNTIESVA